MEHVKTIRFKIKAPARSCVRRLHARLPSVRKLPLSGEEGQSLVESALTFPVMFTLMFCFMTLCLIFYSATMISENAREGTRYAIFHGATCTTSGNASCTATASQINTYVSGLGWPNIGGGTMTVYTCFIPSGGGSCTTGGSEAVGNLVQITVTYVFPISLPYVPRRSITISSTSEAHILQ